MASCVTDVNDKTTRGNFMKPGIPVAFASRTPATFAAFFSRDRAEASVTVTVTATWYAADAGAGAP